MKCLLILCVEFGEEKECGVCFEGVVFFGNCVFGVYCVVIVYVVIECLGCFEFGEDGVVVGVMCWF